MEKPYKPISCSLYDQIELLAMRGELLQIIYLDLAGIEVGIQTRIKDTLVKNSVEYVVLDDGQQIRMDQLVQLGDIDMSDGC